MIKNASTFSKKYMNENTLDSKLKEYFEMESARKNETVPPNVGPSLVNSGNTNTTTTNNVGNTVLDTGSAFDFKSFKRDKAGIL